MHHALSKRPVRSTRRPNHRSARRSLSPYFIHDCALTVAEIHRARCRSMLASSFAVKAKLPLLCAGFKEFVALRLDDALSPLDGAFLYMETERTPMHMASVGIFEGGALYDAEGRSNSTNRGAHRRPPVSLPPSSGRRPTPV